jgi:hypothetical protein
VDLEIILRDYLVDILRGWEIPSTGIKSVRPERYFRKESGYCGGLSTARAQSNLSGSCAKTLPGWTDLSGPGR